MAFHHLKITDSEELLRKHYLCCDTRAALYLKQVAEQMAIENAVSNGWLVSHYTNEELVYHITEKGKTLVYG